MKKSLILLLLLASIQWSLAQGRIFTTSDGAIRGYDPVSYFSDKKPVKGSKQFALTWKDATWYFASQANLELFKANPVKYAPQYGGYCAYGASNGYKADTEPDAWSVVNGKLYLNYNTDVQKDWMKEQAERIKKADANWKTLESKKE